MVSYSSLAAAAVIISSVLHPVTAMWSNAWIVGDTCQTTSGKNFDTCNNQDKQCLCHNPNYLASVALCIKNSVDTTEDVDEAWDYVLVQNCKATPIESDQLYKSSVQYLNTSNIFPVTKYSNYSAIYNTPIFTNREIVRETYNSIYLNLHNRDISTWQGSVLIMIWVVVMGITTVYRFIRYISVTFGSREQSMGRPNKLVRLYYKHISIPAAFGERHIDRYYLFNFIPIFIPTRFETIVGSFYTLMTVIFMCTGYSFMNNNPLWATHYSELALNVSNRAGIIASIQIPLLTLFALRNNILIWLTGWSFSTFNAYHRAIARVTFILAVIHAGAKQTMMLSFHAPLRIIYYPTILFKLGLAALCLMSLMILLGFFRVKHYEIFLFVHVVGAIAAYICILFHLNHLGYKQTMYVSLGLILADFTIRIGRIIFSNIAFYLTPIDGSNRLTEACVSLLPSDVLNVRIRTPIQWPFAPGQYVYIHFNRLNILESHPFSAVGPSSDGESFQLLCKARGGMTKRLRDYIESEGAKEGQKVNMNVLIEGPYGVHCPVERYDTVLLVAGGIGITGIIPYAEYLALSPHYHEIHLIWTVASVDELTWIEERLQWLSETGKARIKLYVTRGGRTKANDTILHHLSDVMSEMDNVDLHNDIEMSKIIHFENEDDNLHLVGNGTAVHHNHDLRKKLSIKKHMRNISHTSNVFNVDVEERMENVDGDQMVDWTDDRSDRGHGLRRKISHLSRRSRTTNEISSPTSEKLEIPTTSGVHSNINPGRESISNYNNGNYRYSYAPGKKASAILSSADDSGMKNFNHTSIHVQEMPNPQLWMNHIIEGSRPNLNSTVVELFKESTGSVCIVGCGPSRMMDSLRRSAADNYDLVENGRMDYYEEAFTW